ncbi:MAG TPA: hypothetical protein VJM32_05800 [Candidatus Saccharimonadales bacterium]|nr:hypothetical protein [Candidatus Saccharimonadales bacterium]
MPNDESPGDRRRRSVLIVVSDARLIERREGIVGSALRWALEKECRRFGVTLAFVPDESGNEAALMEFADWQIRIVDHRGLGCRLDETLLPVAQFLCTKGDATDKDVKLLCHTLHLKQLRRGERRLEGDSLRDSLRLMIQWNDGFKRLPDDWDPQAPDNQGNPATTG